jgi:hypothetical protein
VSRANRHSAFPIVSTKEGKNMDKVAKGMTEASRHSGGCCGQENKGKGIAQSLKDLASEAVCKVKDYMTRSRRPVRR